MCIKLLKSYCSSFYGLTTWTSYHVYVKKKLEVAYKKIFRALFKYKHEGTTSNMLNQHIIPFKVIERKYMYGFMKRLEICDNLIIHKIVNSVFYRSSGFYLHYIKLLYRVP